MHLLAVEPDLAAGALLDAGDLAHEGGLAGAVVTHDGDMLAFAQLEVGVLQRVHAAVVLGQVFGSSRTMSFMHMFSLMPWPLRGAAATGRAPRRRR